MTKTDRKKLFEKALNDYPYTVHNNGFHWKLVGIDIYPTTGKWVMNGKSHKGTPEDLLNFINKLRVNRRICEIINTETGDSTIIRDVADLSEFLAVPYMVFK